MYYLWCLGNREIYKRFIVMEQYIKKSALLAEIKEMLSKLNLDSPFGIGAYTNLSILLDRVDTLEVKEVDLDNEYIEEVYSHLDSIKDTADRMTSGNFMHNRAAIKFSANTIAKVLELMGLKAQKGE